MTFVLLFYFSDYCVSQAINDNANIDSDTSNVKVGGAYTLTCNVSLKSLNVNLSYAFQISLISAG